ncbi:uncharacterized protein adm2b [Archocentrus centrarchus]|uniref:uncharacterized protein adm2b n=1 Tax=Archocentrus centrarchus TaxID=63155 RepID=UPI0011EA0C19|nr:protein ADM2 [Archocentrus centrarchus]
MQETGMMLTMSLMHTGHFTLCLRYAAMCALRPAWVCLLLGLLPLEIQSQTLTLQRTHRHRLSFPRTSKYQKSSYPSILPTMSDLSVAADNQITEEDRHIIWRALLLHKEPPPMLPDPLVDQGHNVLPEAPVWQRGSRGRRHAGRGRGQGHLMRVGCVLGTCQVQNLSHRLYQLIGQSGREDSSPINPRSPHSYG